MSLNRAEKELVQRLIQNPYGNLVVEIIDFIDYQKGGEKGDLYGMENYYAEYRQDGVDFVKVEQAQSRGWGDRIKPRMASRVASRYLEKQGFNKYNVPELVGQLMSVMEKNGLDDTVAELKQKGFTRIINKAWQNRER